MQEVARLSARPHWHASTTRRFVMAGVVLALTLLSTIAVIAWRSIAAFEEGARSLAGTYAVIAEVGQVETAHARMRSAWRTYLTSHAQDALDDYRASRAALEDQLAQLAALTGDNPAQRARVAALGDAVRQDLQATDDAIHLKRSGSLAESNEILQAIVARSAERERITGIVDIAKHEERSELAAHELANALQAARAKAWILAGSLASLAMLAFAFAALRREIVWRTRAQVHLERYAREVAELYNNAPCGYHSIDADGVVVRINDTELGMLGYARDEIVGRMRASALMTPDSAAAFEAQRAALAAGAAPLRGEYTYVRKDGAAFVARIDATLHRERDGGRGECRAAMIDVTEQKAAEDEVRNLNRQLTAYSGRLEATNKELESFSYSVSHDLRAPLRAINGFASMLKEDYGDALDAEGRRLLGVVRANAEAMAQLIDDLLAFSRVGKGAFVETDVDMNSLVSEVLVERADHVPVAVAHLPVARGDRALLKQVWANLIDNAIKYTARAGVRDIRISGIAGEDGASQYRIDDNGAGFDMRYYDKLFGVFQRLHGASEFPGTGVGLAIVQRIVGRHDGRVWAEGRPGAGATFHFQLPARGPDG
jgi:PAS domain S-box-containing protein